MNMLESMTAALGALPREAPRRRIAIPPDHFMYSRVAQLQARLGRVPDLQDVIDDWRAELVCFGDGDFDRSWDGPWLSLPR